MAKRRRFSGELKAKVALEALRGDRTLQEIASKHRVHPNPVRTWKRQAIEGLGEMFSNGVERRRRDHESEVHELHAKIGELTVERDCKFRHAESLPNGYHLRFRFGINRRPLGSCHLFSDSGS